MADLYFSKTKTAQGSYWRLVRVAQVKPEERSGLALELQEYQVMSGDIGEPGQAAKGMERIRNDLAAAGHRLHYQAEAKTGRAKDLIMAIRTRTKHELPQIGDRVRHTEDPELGVGRVLDSYTNWEEGVTYYTVEFEDDQVADCMLSEIEVV